MSRSLVVISFLVVALLNHYELTRERLQTHMYLCDFTALQTLQKISVLPDRTGPTELFRFGSGSVHIQTSVRSGPENLRTSVFGPFGSVRFWTELTESSALATRLYLICIIKYKCCMIIML